MSDGAAITLVAPAPEHFGRIAHAKTIATARFKGLTRRIALAQHARKILLVYGEAGLGKTHAIRHLLTGTDFAEITFAETPRRRETVDAVHEALTGSPGRGPASAIERALRREVGVRQRFLVVDEVESLTAKRLTLLRALSDIPGSELTIIFIGDETAAAKIRADRRLASRILTAARFERLSARAVLSYLPRYHPTYRGADQRLLLEVDEELVHGEWRAIARLTQAIEFVSLEHNRPADSPLNAEVLALAQELFWEPNEPDER